MTILLIIAAVILAIGLIRVLVTPFTSVLNTIGQFFMLDLVFQLLAAMFENMGDLFDL